MEDRVTNSLCVPNPLDGISDERETRTDTAESYDLRDRRRANPRPVRRINNVPLFEPVIVTPEPIFDRFAVDCH